MNIPSHKVTGDYAIRMFSWCGWIAFLWLVTASQGYSQVARDAESVLHSVNSDANQVAGVLSPESQGDDWLGKVQVGYDEGFVIASVDSTDLGDEFPFRMRVNGWGQLRHTIFDSHGTNIDKNQFGLKRARLIFEGNAFTPDFEYFIQLDGRSSSGDDFRLLDFVLNYDLGSHALGMESGRLGFKTGKYKMPFTMARQRSGKQFEFTDRSMASTFFDVNRSLAWGVYGTSCKWRVPVHWETAIFNGFVTGGAETGSSGSIDKNFAYAARVTTYPRGKWGSAELADLEWHQELATRVGAAYAASTMDEIGSTEFSSLRVVDEGRTLSSFLLPLSVTEYSVSTYTIDASCKYRGGSATMEYYFRNVNGFQGGPAIPDLYDHGFWLQMGKFIQPGKLQFLGRWSHVVGNSGTLGASQQRSNELAAAVVLYLRGQHAKVTFDATYLDGAPINSSSLDVTPNDHGWLFRSQIQFAF